MCKWWELQDKWQCLSPSLFRLELHLSVGGLSGGSLWMPLFAKKQRQLLLFISLESGAGDGCCMSGLAKLFTASLCLWDSPCAPL